MSSKLLFAAALAAAALFAAAPAAHAQTGHDHDHGAPAEHGDVQEAAQGVRPAVEADGEHGEGHGQAAHADHTAHGEAHGGHGSGHHEDPSKYFNFFDGIGPNVIAMPWTKQDAKGGDLGDGKLGDEPLAAGEAERPRQAPFGLLVFNFGILLLILYKWGVPAARNIAETRSDQIKTALDEAARLRDQARAKLDEYSTKLKAAEDEIAQLVTGMRKDAEAEKQRVIASAEAQAKAMQRDAEERISAEIARARLLLQREVAVAATTVAEQLLRERATAADQTVLVDRFISEVNRSDGAGAPATGRRA
jgi:F-type H+-transporting ATPase subunit b